MTIDKAAEILIEVGYGMLGLAEMICGRSLW